MIVTDCPRDAMQGLKDFIPTELKIKYINQLLKVGFANLDFGSFVSPYAIPQLKDTPLVISKLELTNTKLLAIVANLRGANDACFFDEVSILGYPFSVSETFQLRNTNATIADSLGRVEELVNLTSKYNKDLVVYLSMGFGNPYGDVWSPEIVAQWATKLASLGVKNLSLADTVGTADVVSITNLFSYLIPALPNVAFSAHLHTLSSDWKPKVEAAYNAGCVRFDGALKGFGGCPMAADTLTGNMPTENLIAFANERQIDLGIDTNELNLAMQIADEIFMQYH